MLLGWVMLHLAIAEVADRRRGSGEAVFQGSRIGLGGIRGSCGLITVSDLQVGTRSLVPRLKMAGVLRRLATVNGRSSAFVKAFLFSLAYLG